MKKTDVTIIGAGMMGLALALGLAKQNLKVCIIDAKAIKENHGQGAYDLRVSAITPATARFFASLNVLDQILATRSSAFDKMYVCDEKSNIQFDAAELGESDLGWIIENTVIQTILLEELKSFSQVELFAAKQVEHINTNESYAEVFLTDSEIIQSKLLVAADGANSWVRQYLDMSIKTWPYEQLAIVANVRSSQSHQHTAWQRFLPTGPLAFLPLNDEHLSSIVWSCHTETAQELMALDEAAFNSIITEKFSQQLGEIELASQRMSFPLVMRHIHDYVRPNLAFIGDAAHTIHPLAGQGANLGFADVMKLLEIIELAQGKGVHLGDYGYLRKYERARKTEVSRMIMLMEGFHRLFSNQHSMLSLLRNQGLTIVDRLGPIKNKMVRFAMGV